MFKSFITITLALSSITVFSDTSEQYIHRSEFFFCNFNDGKDYIDLLEEQASYEDFLVENDLQYNRINLLPICREFACFARFGIIITQNKFYIF